MERLEHIALVGPIAEPGRPAVGGYESANLRLLEILQRIVPRSRAIAYPRADGSAWRKSRQYAVGFCKILWTVATAPGRKSAIHFTPLCRHFLGAELLVALAARARGNFLTVDLRAGMQKRRYDDSSTLYRWAFRRLLSLASAVTYEGREYAAWLDGLVPDTKKSWLPNFVPAAMVRRREAGPLPAAPRLVYVGRVSQAKGVDAALRVFAVLRERFPGAALTLVGRYDEKYRRDLERQGLLSHDVEFAGSLAPSAIEPKLDDSHFFLFLSQWYGEGHSNALTEAMARGCVPVASNHGFNRSVVGDCAPTIEDRDDAEHIAAIVEDIWRNGRWPDMSNAAATRVAENFTDRRVLEILSDIYGGRPLDGPSH